MFIREKDGIITHSTLGKFTELDGGETSIPTEKHKAEPNGPDIIFAGNVERSPITLKRLYDPLIDLPNQKRNDQGDPLAGDTSVQFIDPDGFAIPGAVEGFQGCNVTKITPPAKNANSTAASWVSYECEWVKRV